MHADHAGVVVAQGRDGARHVGTVAVTGIVPGITGLGHTGHPAASGQILMVYLIAGIDDADFARQTAGGQAATGSRLHHRDTVGDGLAETVGCHIAARIKLVLRVAEERVAQNFIQVFL